MSESEWKHFIEVVAEIIRDIHLLNFMNLKTENGIWIQRNVIYSSLKFLL